MADERLERAKRAYETMCRMLDRLEWRYDKDDEALEITCSVQGDDIPMRIRMVINPDQDLAFVISRLPFAISEDKRMDAAVATTIINNYLVDGCFDFNLQDGSVYFKLTNRFVDTELSEEAFKYMLLCSCSTVDEYNDKYLLLDRGKMTVEDFFEEG